MKKTFKIKGMHCNSCAERIENSLKEKVNNIEVSYAKEQAEIDFNSDKISEKEIVGKIYGLGYEIPNKKEKTKKKIQDKIGFYVMIGSIAIFIIAMYLIFKRFDVQIPAMGESSSLFLLFFAGLLTGFHCISMCGAFILSYTTKNALKGHKSFKQHLIYGTAKVISYAVIGGIFGFIGGLFAFSIGLRGTIAILAGIFMLFYSMSMMGIPFFKRFQFNPKFLTKVASKTSAEAKGPYKAPLITGLLGGLFIACGPLQAMYIYAAGTGNIFTGMASLAAFGLGTLPIMLGFGSLATVISHKTTKKILKISAIIVLILGLVILNRGLTMVGSSFSYDSIKGKITGVDSQTALIEKGIQVK